MREIGVFTQKKADLNLFNDVKVMQVHYCGYGRRLGHVGGKTLCLRRRIVKDESRERDERGRLSTTHTGRSGNSTQAVERNRWKG